MDFGQPLAVRLFFENTNADGHLIKAAIDHGAKGIVIQGLGWGNVNLPMFATIKEAIAKHERRSKKNIAPLTEAELSYQYQPTPGS